MHAQNEVTRMDRQNSLTDIFSQSDLFTGIELGEITAATSVIKKTSYPVFAQAVGLSETIGWDRETLLKIMTANPQIAICWGL